MKSELRKKIEEKFDLLETIFVIITAISLILFSLTVKYSQYGIFSGLSLLAILYWFLAYTTIQKNVPLLTTISKKIVYFSYTLSCGSLMFVVLKLTGEEVQGIKPLMLMSAVTLIFGTILYIIDYLKNKTQKITPIIVRSIIFGIILLWFKAMEN